MPAQSGALSDSSLYWNLFLFELQLESKVELTQQCSKKLEKYTDPVDLKAPHVEAQCRVTGSNVTCNH